MDKGQTGCTISYCKRPILSVGVWPIWVGPAHSTIDQPTLYNSNITHSIKYELETVEIKMELGLSNMKKSVQFHPVS